MAIAMAMASTTMVREAKVPATAPLLPKNLCDGDMLLVAVAATDDLVALRVADGEAMEGGDVADEPAILSNNRVRGRVFVR